MLKCQIDALRRSGLRFAPDGRLVVDDAAEALGLNDRKRVKGFGVSGFRV